MRYLFANKSILEIEITSSALRLAVVSGRKESRSVLFSKAVALPPGVVNENYATQNIDDMERFIDVFREALAGISTNVKRTALSLPDGVFRVQTLEFDELPNRTAERERLIRWRLEKSALDVADTVLRYQVLRRKEKNGFSVLACVAKQAVIAQYESVLSESGLEPWTIGPSSFHAFNLYQPYLVKMSPVSVLAHIYGSGCATLISGSNGMFYRYKDVKRGDSDGAPARLVREIGDFLHYYINLDHAREDRVHRLYLTGSGALLPGLSDGLADMTSLDIEVLTPSVVLSSANGMGTEMSAALGAGYSL